MRGRVVISMLLGLLSVCVGRAQAAPIIYSQAAAFPNGTFHASQNETEPGGFGNFATAYDDFVLTGDALITDLHWTGGYFAGGQAPITSFTATFWSNSGGQPGVSLLSQTIAGTAGETFLGNDPNDGPVYTYSLILPTSFSATAGTRYWLSIVPELNFPPQWGWYTSTAGNGIAYQDFFGARSPLANDFAFDLTSEQVVPVPEPTAMLLLGTGLIGVGIRRNRRRQEQ